MNEKKTSKFLSLVLRHKPEQIGITLDPQGWVDVDVLLAAVRAHGHSLDRPSLERVVAQNDKRRFTLSSDGKRIRAAQGHSVNVSLGLTPVAPPSVLYHGTVARHLPSIRRDGLKPGQRTHVHLSGDISTAETVGARYGDPHLLRVDAATMHNQGHAFFQADNGVWLIDHVPPQFLTDVGQTKPAQTEKKND
ncbi:RNA 2'-phosphotransferase [uncultured Aliiroseovarius sp.]|uniref:RNA 2'-phosphotransferase n=1 Tax=uncultured Aliiroseovarius sp. TaxID=1658783 RepID=UPI0026175600|nr:RNA 2'-phosphotransferase [uncultured Aliiroseovarius sp.]